MHALTVHPDVSPADRLGVAFFFAVLAHLIVILGVTFAHEDRPKRHATTLDVVLVPVSAAEVPDRPDYLAQANRDGSGESTETVRPETPPPAPPAALEPTPANLSAEAVTGAAFGMSADESRPVDRATTSASVPMTATIVEDGPVESLPPVRGTDADPPVSRSVELAALSAELERKLRSYPERLRRKWISARTREDRFAAYMDAWRRKVERTGNQSYPEEALQRGLSGSLLLEVALNPDGTVKDIVLRRSSGLQVLDDAAVRTVRLAAPFDRFPESIADEVDVLHIERTWIFHSDNRFTSP